MTVAMRIVVVLLVVLGTVVVGKPADGDGPGAAPGQDCHAVHDLFGLDRDAGHVTTDSGEASSLCESKCCRQSMDKHLLGAARKELHESIQRASASLRSLLSDTSDKLKDEIASLVHRSANNTVALFHQVYQKMATLASGPISILYSDMESFVLDRKPELNLVSSVDTFFDQLFPLVYHLTLNPSLKDFSDDYKECLRATQAEVNPFGEVPRRLSRSLSRSLEAARSLLQALHLGVEALNTTQHLPLSPECQPALVKMVICPKCAGLGHPASLACPGLCHNTIRGCLAGVAELEQPWNEFTGAIERVSGVVAGSGLGASSALALTEVLGGLDARISEAVMVAMENGPQLEKKVKSVCGHPRRMHEENSSSTTTSSPSSTAPSSPSPSTWVTSVPRPVESHHLVESGGSDGSQLGATLQHFLTALLPSRGIFSGFADSVCSDGAVVAPSDANCWNGARLGEYQQPVAGVGLSAQKYNPEMRVQRNQNAHVAQLSDKLRHMRQLLHSHLAVVPASDSLVVEETGSGSGYLVHPSWPEDEERWGENGSGSGDHDIHEPTSSNAGGKTSSTGFDFDPDTTPEVSVPVDSSSATSPSTLAILLSMALSWWCAKGVWLNG